MQSAVDEKQFLDGLVKEYPSCDKSPHLRVMRHMILRTFLPHIKGGVGLEMGCEVGYMTGILAPLFYVLDVVDGSEEFINIARVGAPANVKFTLSLFEEYDTGKKYDAVVASHVLEHLGDVGVVLDMVKRVMHPDGVFLVAVPNAKAASRQLAKHMGVVHDLYGLTPNDIKGGHRRVYDQESLVKEVEQGGMQVVEQGGIYFKPFADFQMDILMEDGVVGIPQIEGMYAMGKEYPHMCADSYVVAKIKG